MCRKNRARASMQKMSTKTYEKVYFIFNNLRMCVRVQVTKGCDDCRVQRQGAERHDHAN